jgi:hypothetical protein
MTWGGAPARLVLRITAAALLLFLQFGLHWSLWSAAALAVIFYVAAIMSVSFLVVVLATAREPAIAIDRDEIVRTRKLRGRMSRAFAPLLASVLVFAGQPASAKEEQALIVRLKLADDAFGAEGESFALYPVEDAIELAVKGHGEFDGHEIGGGYFTIYIYGRDADDLYRAVAPVLAKASVRSGSYVLKRRGGPEQPSEKVMVATSGPHDK